MQAKLSCAALCRGPCRLGGAPKTTLGTTVQCEAARWSAGGNCKQGRLPMQPFYYQRYTVSVRRTPPQPLPVFLAPCHGQDGVCYSPRLRCEAPLTTPDSVLQQSELMHGPH